MPAKLTLLGTGSFVSDLEHMGPGYLLEIDGKKILVDAGCGVQIQLLKLGIGIADLDYIFITHFHADHTCDLYSMLMRRYMLDAIYKKELKPLYIYGPNGMENFVRVIAKIHQLDYVDKFKNIFYEGLTDRTKKEFNDFSVEVFSVEHLGSDVLAYRVEIKEKTVVFSGDTTVCDGIKDAIQSADLFVADCSATKEHPIEAAHLSSIDIGKISQEGNVKKVVLSHLLPLGYNTDLVGEVKESFNGKVILGEDLMELEV